MGPAQVLVVSLTLFITTEEAYYKSGLVVVRNKRSVKSKAYSRACTRHNCSNALCPNTDGWGLFGSDWGCCGNYDGCCEWASVVCYAHDVICQCCDYGWWCGPDCKQEPECSGSGKKLSFSDDVDDSVINEIPDLGKQASRVNNIPNISEHKHSKEPINTIPHASRQQQTMYKINRNMDKRRDERLEYINTTSSNRLHMHKNNHKPNNTVSPNNITAEKYVSEINHAQAANYSFLDEEFLQGTNGNFSIDQNKKNETENDMVDHSNRRNITNRDNNVKDGQQNYSGYLIKKPSDGYSSQNATTTQQPVHDHQNREKGNNSTSDKNIEKYSGVDSNSNGNLSDEVMENAFLHVGYMSDQPVLGKMDEDEGSGDV